MKCPQCGAEYKDGFTKCSDCGVELVEGRSDYVSSIALVKHADIVRELRSQSTWRLFFLAVITLGIYIAYYIRRQTSALNQHLEERHRISGGLVLAILIFAYVGVAAYVVVLGVTFGFVQTEPWIEDLVFLFDTWSDLALTLLYLVWAFKARNRAHTLLDIRKGHPHWFSGLFTFLFTAFYFNFKVNCLNEVVRLHTGGGQHIWDEEKQRLIDDLSSGDAASRAYAKDMLEKYVAEGNEEAAKLLERVGQG